MISKEFKEIVRDGLERQGLSLRQAALRAGLSASYLSRVLSGERDFPSTDAIIRLARVLGIQPPDRLLAYAGRVRHRAARELSEKEIDEVMAIIRDVVREHRRPKRRRVS